MASNQISIRPLRISLKDNISDTLAQISFGSKPSIVTSSQSTIDYTQAVNQMKSQSLVSAMSFSSNFSERESLSSRLITSISPDQRMKDQFCSESLRLNLYSSIDPSYYSNQCPMSDRAIESNDSNRLYTSRISLVSNASQQTVYSERPATKSMNISSNFDRFASQQRGPLLTNNQASVLSQTHKDFQAQVRTSESQKLFYSSQDLTKTNEETPPKPQVSLSYKSSHYYTNSVSISPSKTETENVRKNLEEPLSNPRKSNLKGSMRSNRSSMKGSGRKGPKRTVNFMESHETIAVSKYIGKEDYALFF